MYVIFALSGAVNVIFAMSGAVCVVFAVPVAAYVIYPVMSLPQSGTRQGSIFFVVTKLPLEDKEEGSSTF